MWPDSMGALFYLQANSRVEERFSSTKMRREENRRPNSVEHLGGGLYLKVGPPIEGVPIVDK